MKCRHTNPLCMTDHVVTGYNIKMVSKFTSKSSSDLKLEIANPSIISSIIVGLTLLRGFLGFAFGLLDGERPGELESSPLSGLESPGLLDDPFFMAVRGRLDPELPPLSVLIASLIQHPPTSDNFLPIPYH